MNKRTKIVAAVVVLALVAGAATAVYVKKISTNDMPGTVQGANPHHIPESKLPECNFTGANFVQEPCYVPPGVIYF